MNMLKLEGETESVPSFKFLFLMKDLEAKFVVLLRDLNEDFFVLPAELLPSEPAPPPWVGLWLPKELPNPQADKLPKPDK